MTLLTPAQAQPPKSQRPQQKSSRRVITYQPTAKPGKKHYEASNDDDSRAHAYSPMPPRNLASAIQWRVAGLGPESASLPVCLPACLPACAPT
ncbi:hypothetical protein CSAL01_06722 [Colletotrichum salicis]|uniref:Uncharacterized protein n=1 Tax=Colletotrichum salicis TaxID=1209931 RepID=A0A135UZ75_9PEZI|nr:hypothetical protein CSAL01_06722 [Colletotrichum salicis]